MTYECHLTEKDYRCFRSHIKYRYLKIHWQFGFMFLLLLAMIWYGGGAKESITDKLYLLIGTVFLFAVVLGVFLGLYALFQRVTRQRFRGPLGRHLFDVSAEGIKETNEFGTNETKTAGIRAVDEATEYFFIVARNGVGYIIPKRGHSDFSALRELGQMVGAKRQ